MQKINYRFSPSLLNQFSLFLTEEGYTKKDENGDDEHIPFVTFQKLMDAINRVPFETTEAQQKGIDFENEVIALASGDETVLLGRTPEYCTCLKEVVNKLPDYFEAQKPIQRQYKDVLFYGFTDVAGGCRIIDIKTSSQAYSFGKFLNSHQNLYLWALEPQGYTTMEYLFTNFKNVFPEVYGLDYNFQPLFEEMEFFCDFVEQHKELITNPKIFNYRYELKSAS